MPPPLNWSKYGICIWMYNSTRTIFEKVDFFRVKSDKSGPFWGLRRIPQKWTFFQREIRQKWTFSSLKSDKGGLFLT